jgi:hypothetical protein
VTLGSPATAFATIINAGNSAATDCSIAPMNAPHATFTYQTTDPTTNELTGTADTPVDISGMNGSQSFVFALAPIDPFDPTDIQLRFGCTNSNAAPVVNGLNTLLMSASSTPVPDIVALAATQTMDGVVDVPGPTGANAFAVASVNVGAGSEIVASAELVNPALPVLLFICQTDPMANCLTPPEIGVTTTIDANATPTFSVFVNGTGEVPFDPAANRIRVTFSEPDGTIRGQTSVAVRTVEPPMEPPPYPL